jgi:hypothetical protein
MKHLFYVIIILSLWVPFSANAETTAEIVLKVLQCESSFRNNVWGDVDTKYPSYGIAQFQERTFNWLKELAGRKELNWKNPSDQIWLLRWSIEHGYGHYWTCYRKYLKQQHKKGGTK